MLLRSDQRSAYLIHHGGWVMLRTITKNMFDTVAGLMIIAAVFYLAAITHIVPLPENALKRLGEVSTDIMGVLFAWGARLASLLL